MGNYRFNLSELIPNAWFYKLRDMGRSTRKQPRRQNIILSPSPATKHHAVPTPTTTTARSPRRSSYYSRPPKTTPSTSPTRSRPPAAAYVKPSAPKHAASPAVRCRADQLLDFSTTTGDSTATGSFSPEFRSDQVLLPEDSSNSTCRSPCSCASSRLSKAAAFIPPPNQDLRPIITKQANKSTVVRKTAVRSPAGTRLRLRSPRITTRKSVSSGARRSGSWASARRSRAVVKASVDPRRDFKESMEEMIEENNIRASKDLEDLLACYLCLNADEYHALIINVFKQIWLHLHLPPPYST